MSIVFLRTITICFFLMHLVAGLPGCRAAQGLPKTQAAAQPVRDSGETVQEYNLRLQQLERMMGSRDSNRGDQEYHIGPEDLLEISVLEAPELSRVARVSESGEVSLPLLGAVPAAGRTPREEESVLEELLRRSYMKDPHVSVFVKEMQSHSVAVFGAVKKPGVYQIRGPKTLVEVLSMAEGVANDAGDTALVIHQGVLGDPMQTSASESNAKQSPGRERPAPISEVKAGEKTGENELFPELRTVEINLKSLLDSDDRRANALVFPGDEVKVTRAGIVYVVGAVKRPGGFQLKGNENISVLQALALAEGLTATSGKSRARIIRTDNTTGKRNEIPIDLAKVLSGKASDPGLQHRDILFIPNSAGRSALYRGIESAVSVGTGLAIYRR